MGAKTKMLPCFPSMRPTRFFIRIRVFHKAQSICDTFYVSYDLLHFWLSKMVNEWNVQFQTLKHSGTIHGTRHIIGLCPQHERNILLFKRAFSDCMPLSAAGTRLMKMLDLNSHHRKFWTGERKEAISWKMLFLCGQLGQFTSRSVWRLLFKSIHEYQWGHSLHVLLFTFCRWLALD